MSVSSIIDIDGGKDRDRTAATMMNREKVGAAAETIPRGKRGANVLRPEPKRLTVKANSMEAMNDLLREGERQKTQSVQIGLLQPRVEKTYQKSLSYSTGAMLRSPSKKPSAAPELPTIPVLDGDLGMDGLPVPKDGSGRSMLKREGPGVSGTTSSTMLGTSVRNAKRKRVGEEDTHRQKSTKTSVPTVLPIPRQLVCVSRRSSCNELYRLEPRREESVAEDRLAFKEDVLSPSLPPLSVEFNVSVTSNIEGEDASVPTSSRSYQTKRPSLMMSDELVASLFRSV